MTRFNNKYPYTDFHELNADWLLETVKDAAAEAQEASDTVATYNDRLTTVEGDLAPIKAAMPGLASDVSGLQHDVGIMDSLITNTINPGLDTLQNEVETASTGLLDRMTAAEGSISTLENEVEAPSTGLLDRVTVLENQPATQSNAVYYLEFDSSLVVIDPDNAYDSRIKYDWLKQFVPLNTSGEDTHVIKLYDSHTQKVYDLAGFHLQESVSPDGIFVFTNRAEHLTGGIIDYYVNSTVIVSQNASNPAFAEENESLLPAVTSADAGNVLTVDNSGNWVNDAISIPETESGSITYSHTDITAAAYWYRIGEVVTVTSLFHADYNGLTGVLFTLPYVPKAGFGTFFRCSSPNADLQAWVSGTTGDVSITTSTNAGNNYGVSFSYVRA